MCVRVCAYGLGFGDARPLFEALDDEVDQLVVVHRERAVVEHVALHRPQRPRQHRYEQPCSEANR